MRSHSEDDVLLMVMACLRPVRYDSNHCSGTYLLVQALEQDVIGTAQTPISSCRRRSRMLSAQHKHLSPRAGAGAGCYRHSTNTYLLVQALEQDVISTAQTPISSCRRRSRMLSAQHKHLSPHAGAGAGCYRHSTNTYLLVQAQEQDVIGTAQTPISSCRRWSRMLSAQHKHLSPRAGAGAGCYRHSTNTYLLVQALEQDVIGTAQTPISSCRRWSRMLSSTVSNAAYKSRRIRITACCLSTAHKRSLVTRTKAVSML